MNPHRRNDRTTPLLLLLLGLLSLYAARQLLHLWVEPRLSCQERHYIRIRGDLSRAGFYAFCSPPTREEALRAAGVERRGEDPLPTRLVNGDTLVVRKEGIDRVDREELNGFFKMTLGIPISINGESEAGFTALPEIGPGLAHAIVTERERRGGFRSVEELSSVAGIGPQRYTRIRPYVKL